jgi:hypothetical protein
MEWWSDGVMLNTKTKKYHNLLFSFQYSIYPVLQYSTIVFPGMTKKQ